MPVLKEIFNRETQLERDRKSRATLEAVAKELPWSNTQLRVGLFSAIDGLRREQINRIWDLVHGKASSTSLSAIAEDLEISIPKKEKFFDTFSFNYHDLDVRPLEIEPGKFYSMTEVLAAPNRVPVFQELDGLCAANVLRLDPQTDLEKGISIDFYYASPFGNDWGIRIRKLVDFHLRGKTTSGFVIVARDRESQKPEVFQLNPSHS